MKKDNGITMVTLAVTIIILIILAGVSINTLVGDNGIITMAEKARENIMLAQTEEQKQLNELYEELEQNQGSTIPDEDEQIAKLLEQLKEKEQIIQNLTTELNTFKKQIATAITEEGIQTAETDTAETMAQNIHAIAGKAQQLNGTLGTYRHVSYAIATLTIDVSDYDTFEIGTFTGYRTTDNYFYLSITADDTTLTSESGRSIDYLNTNYAGKTYDISNVTTLTIQFSQIENSVRYEANMTYTLK